MSRWVNRLSAYALLVLVVVLALFALFLFDTFDSALPFVILVTVLAIMFPTGLIVIRTKLKPATSLPFWVEALSYPLLVLVCAAVELYLIVLVLINTIDT